MTGKKNVLWSILAFILAGLTVWAIMTQTKNFSLERFWEYCIHANPVWILTAFALMAGYIIFEGMAVLTVCKGLGYKGRFRDGILYSSADIYFSAITPSATGGQPASAFFMIKDGLPTPVCTVALLLNLVMYTASIVFLGIVAIATRPMLFGDFNSFSQFLIILGYLILLLCAVFFILLIKKESILYAICDWGIRVLNHFKFVRHPEKLRKKLDHATEEYSKCGTLLWNRKAMMAKVFGYNLLQRTCQILVPVAVYMAMKGPKDKSFDIFVTQIFVTIGSNCLPVPGAMGVYDYLLIDGLRDKMPEVLATNMELLSRSISFYISVFLCLIVVILGYVRRVKSKRKRLHEV